MKTCTDVDVDVPLSGSSRTKVAGSDTAESRQIVSRIKGSEDGRRKTSVLLPDIISWKTSASRVLEFIADSKIERMVKFAMILIISHYNFKIKLQFRGMCETA